MPSRTKQTQPFRPKRVSPIPLLIGKTILRGMETRNSFPQDSKHASSSTKFWNPTLSTAHLATARCSSGRKIGLLCGTMGRVNRHSKVRNGFRIPFRLTPPLSIVPISLIFLPVKKRRDRTCSPKTCSRTPSFYSRLSLVPKENGKLHPVIDLILNQYIRKQPFKLEAVKSVRQLILANNWAVSIDLRDAYLHVLIHLQSRKYFRFMFRHQVFPFTVLPFRMSLSPWIFTILMDVIAAHFHQHAISPFLYLDDWLTKDLIRNRLISHTIYCLQTVQSLSFIPNLKKSDLIPAQKFTWIGMEFLTQLNIVRVPADRVDSLILSRHSFLRLKFRHKLSFLFWANSVQQQTSFSWADFTYDLCKCVYYLSGDIVFFHSIIVFWLSVWFDSIWNGEWTPIASFKERPFLQIPMHSFIRMPVITVGELI